MLQVEAILSSDAATYLESDCDEQLIVAVGFDTNVKIHSLRLRAPADGPF